MIQIHFKDLDKYFLLKKRKNILEKCLLGENDKHFLAYFDLTEDDVKWFKTIGITAKSEKFLNCSTGLVYLTWEDSKLFKSELKKITIELEFGE